MAFWCWCLGIDVGVGGDGSRTFKQVFSVWNTQCKRQSMINVLRYGPHMYIQFHIIYAIFIAYGG